MNWNYLPIHSEQQQEQYGWWLFIYPNWSKETSVSRHKNKANTSSIHIIVKDYRRQRYVE